MTSRETTADGLVRTFATNTLGPFLLTNLLLPALGESATARVINVSSAAMYFAMLNISDPQFDRRPRATHRRGFGRSSEAQRASYWDLCCRLAGYTPGTAAMH